MVSPDRRQLLPQHFGASARLIAVLGHDGCLGDHDSGAAVLELGVEADLLALAETFPVDPRRDADLTVRDEETAHLLLLAGCYRCLERMRGDGGERRLNDIK